MPFFPMKCESCGSEFEVVTKNYSKKSPERRKCPICGKWAYRVWEAPAVHFKGSGFYCNDYKNKK